jgi:hypothetical protein
LEPCGSVTILGVDCAQARVTSTKDATVDIDTRRVATNIEEIFIEPSAKYLFSV